MEFFMRDIRMTQEYSRKMLEIKNRDIIWTNSMISKLIDDSGKEYKGVRLAFMRQSNLYMSKIRLLYSSGAPLENIRELFFPMMDSITASWTRECSHIDMLWLVSIGIMLDIPVELLQQLGALVKKYKYSDYLQDFLFNSIDSTWKRETKTFNAPVYTYLHEVINTKSKDKAKELLKDYLENQWYIGHIGLEWHDSHKNKSVLYAGYWSFESGAIAKIMGLDDSGWEN
jgi:hypothetical protein